LDTEQLIRDVVRNVLQKLQEEKKSSQTVVSSGTGTSPGVSAIPGTAVGAAYVSPDAEKVVTAKPSQTLRVDRRIVVGISVRHVHLCREHLDVLFGKGYILNVLRELYNPGYACKEAVTIVGPKLTAIQNVRILGPLRNKTQVERAKTDCIVLGIDAPVRASGDIAGSSSCVLIGPKGAVYLSEGVIRANRHLHMGVEDAEYFGIKDNQLVDVRVGGPKGLTFNNVQIRVAPDFKQELHVDTDDGNAADVVNGSLVEIVDATCVSPIPAMMADKDKIPPSIPDGSFVGEITDPNLLKMCAVSTGQPCIREQLAGAAATTAASPTKPSAQAPPGEQDKKILITIGDLDSYVQTGIRVNRNVILSPLARDEAIKRGIQITYE
jgi:putative phosphotransacetylase